MSLVEYRIKDLIWRLERKVEGLESQEVYEIKRLIREIKGCLREMGMSIW